MIMKLCAHLKVHRRVVIMFIRTADVGTVCTLSVQANPEIGPRLGTVGAKLSLKSDGSH